LISPLPTAGTFGAFRVLDSDSKGARETGLSDADLLESLPELLLELELCDRDCRVAGILDLGLWSLEKESCESRCDILFSDGLVVVLELDVAVRLGPSVFDPSLAFCCSHASMLVDRSA